MNTSIVRRPRIARLLRLLNPLVSVALAIAALLDAPTPTSAASSCYIVTNTNDSGGGSLRSAIDCAAPGTTITFNNATFNTPQTITLTSGVLEITKTLVISGPGASLLTISAGNASRVFLVSSDSALYGMTLRDGYSIGNGGAVNVSNGTLTLSETHIISSSAAGSGGGIASSGRLLMYSTVVSDNVAAQGGGLYSTNAVSFTTDLLIANNHASGAGGGAYIAGDFLLFSARVTGNSAGDAAGGFYSSGSAGLLFSEISGNSAQQNQAGFWTDGGLTMLNSSVLSNTAGGSRGGFYVASASYITGSQISGNTAGNEMGAFDASGTLSMLNSEISRNRAANYYGGFNVDGNAVISGSTILSNTAVSANQGAGRVAGNLEIMGSSVLSNTAGGDNGGFTVGGSITMTNTTVAYNVAGGSNGGINTEQSLTLVNSIVEHNRGVQHGGARIAGNAVISGTRFADNYANNRGAFGVGGSLVIENSEVVSNTVTGAASGFWVGGSTAMTNTTVAYNTAGGDQGGFQSDGNVIVVDSTIERNAAGGSRGGFYAGGTTQLSNVVVSNNSAGGYAGGFQSDDALTIYDSEIIGNSAGNYGGGFYANSAVWVSNTQIISNATDTYGGGFYASVAVTLHNVDVISNYAASTSGGFYANGAATFDGIDVRANTAGGIAGFYAASTLNMRNSSVVSNTSDSYAGGFYLYGDFDIANVEVLSNTALGDINTGTSGEGGGAYMGSGTGVLSNVTFLNNFARGIGGALYVELSSTTLQSSTLRNNSTAASGGAVALAYDAALFVSDDVVIADNTAGGNGGALFIDVDDDYGPLPQATLSNLTLQGNSAARGGAIASAGVLTLSNVTIAGNSASVDGGGVMLTGTARLVNVTVAANSAPAAAGAYISATAGTLDFVNTILAGPTTDVCGAEAGATVQNTNSIAADADCGLRTVPSVGVGTLGSYGGSGQTVPLVAGSPALDAGDDAACPTADQRGLARVGTCDIGAYESRGFRMTLLGGSVQTTTQSTAFPLPIVARFFSDYSEPLGPGGVLFLDGPTTSATLSPSRTYSLVDADGWVTTTLTAGTVRGTYPVTITAGGIVTPIVGSMTNLPNPLQPLSLTVSGNGFGSVASTPSGLLCSASCVVTFTLDTVVTLTATPATTSTFTGWSGDCNGTNPCVLTMDQLHSVGAAFAAKSSNAALSGLAISAGTLNPTFVSSTLNYTAAVANDVSSLTLTPTLSDPGAAYTVSNASGVCTAHACALAIGANTITVTVRASDGVTVRHYIFVITRAAAPPPSALTLDAMWPTIGVPAGGMPVSLFGSGFLSATRVTVDGVSVTFAIVSDERITFTMPAGANDARVDIAVLAGGASYTLTDAFTYVAPVVTNVSASTGTVFTTTAGVVVRVPPQGVAGSLVVTLTPLAPQPGLPGDVLLHSFELQASLDGQPLAVLTAPVTITLPVDPGIVPAGQRPWLYVWTAEEERGKRSEEREKKRIALTSHSSPLTSLSGGRWLLVPNQSYDAGRGTIAVAVKPMKLYAMSTLRVREYRLPWVNR